MPGGKTTSLYRMTPYWPGQISIEPHECSPSSTRVHHRTGARLNRLEGLSRRLAPGTGRISRVARGDPDTGLECSSGPGSLPDPTRALFMYRDLRHKTGLAVSSNAIYTETLSFFTAYFDCGWSSHIELSWPGEVDVARRRPAYRFAQNLFRADLACYGHRGRCGGSHREADSQIRRLPIAAPRALEHRADDLGSSGFLRNKPGRTLLQSVIDDRGLVIRRQHQHPGG
jgi:hypothetical protein